MATGLLIICTGRGTKQIDEFVAMEKAYSGTLRLGQATLSYDAMSEVEEELSWEHVTGECLYCSGHICTQLQERFQTAESRTVGWA